VVICDRACQIARDEDNYVVALFCASIKTIHEKSPLQGIDISDHDIRRGAWRSFRKGKDNDFNDNLLLRKGHFFIIHLRMGWNDARIVLHYFIINSIKFNYSMSLYCWRSWQSMMALPRRSIVDNIDHFALHHRAFPHRIVFALLMKSRLSGNCPWVLGKQHVYLIFPLCYCYDYYILIMHK